MDVELPSSLLQLLSTTLILHQTCPYLPVRSLLNLGATSKSFRNLIHATPLVFRHLDLTQFTSAQFNIAAIDQGGEVWRNVQLDENLTEDDFYGGPLLGIFNALRRKDILQQVQTLVLDGLAVTSELVREIICDNSLNVRILSIREVQHLNERKLQQALLYAIRYGRPTGTPKLKALYLFGPKDTSQVARFRRHLKRYPTGVAPIDTLPSYGGEMHSQGAKIGAKWNQLSENTPVEDLGRGGDQWYGTGGKVLAKAPSYDWADTILACRGIISFDAVLCNGPRHLSPVAGDKNDERTAPWYRHPRAYLPPCIATYAVGACCKCNTVPEGFSEFGQSPVDQFPLLAPPPSHSSTIKAAVTPSAEDSPDGQLLVRCIDCMQSRYCESCHRWWCEDCYEIPHSSIESAGYLEPWKLQGNALGSHPGKNVKPGVRRSCFECGLTCLHCEKRTHLMCRFCGGGYCTIHNEGSTLITAGRHAIDGCRCSC
ncbi:hypothetical protein BJ875DRAFT_194003 [Amylocarpus encephaloides]|uniref:F-box domain-containing protein n=1 Tax=Amylocarpus encephaloides TaxID=45428 RepID=A0A9P7Y9Z1_9HELO|nr:hypothetical protein BJ875DRAFT_194003 [Amylocarpus encephaloides]